MDKKIHEKALDYLEDERAKLNSVEKKIVRTFFEGQRDCLVKVEDEILELVNRFRKVRKNFEKEIEKFEEK